MAGRWGRSGPPRKIGWAVRAEDTHQQRLPLQPAEPCPSSTPSDGIMRWILESRRGELRWQEWKLLEMMALVINDLAHNDSDSAARRIARTLVNYHVALARVSNILQGAPMMYLHESRPGVYRLVVGQPP